MQRAAATAENAPVQGEFCPQMWASVGLISPLNKERRKSNECSSKVHKIYEKPIKAKKKRKNYIPSLPYNPVLLNTNSLLEWHEKSYKGKKGNDVYTV